MNEEALSRMYLKETSFKALMQHRIFNVLLIASRYDAFMMEEDGRVEDQLYSEYVANERMQQSGAFKPFDEDVFFSSLALKTLIENLLDKDFMENVGANSSLQDVEIVAFGRGIAEAARDFENAAS